MRREIATIVGISTLVAALAYALAVGHYCDWKAIYCWQIEPFGEFYGRSLRGSLFAGFLTLGGFLLSLKTFIIVTMKKEVFESAAYKQEWEEQKKIDSSGKLISLYEPLRYLSTILFVAIICCITTAVLQLTLGLAETTWGAVICLWAGLTSALFLIRCLLLIRLNLTRMFDFLEP